MEPDPGDTFAPTPDRLSEFTRSVMAGDPAGAMIAARKASESPLSDTGAVLISVIGLLYATSAVLRQLRLWTQPIVNKVAAAMGGHPAPRGGPSRPHAAPAANGDPEDAEELKPS